jgi:hypothetical protein
MRRLSDTFMAALQHGFLAGITRRVVEDRDLDLEIRDNYLNLYFKGNSLLQLEEMRGGARYRVTIHPKFLNGLLIPDFVDEDTTRAFLDRIPQLKDNIIRHGKSSLEIEYEQLIIRANNSEPRNNSDYFLIDRQYQVAEGRFDLTGIFWARQGRRRGQEVPLAFIEVKFALNTDIKNVHHQVERYYEAIRPRAPAIAEENEALFRQKLALGLFAQSPERVEAMRTLRFARDITKFQFVLVFVDYNPNSTLLNLDGLAELPFADQIRVFRGGFAMWEQNIRPVKAG